MSRPRPGLRCPKPSWWMRCSQVRSLAGFLLPMSVGTDVSLVWRRSEFDPRRGLSAGSSRRERVLVAHASAFDPRSRLPRGRSSGGPDPGLPIRRTVFDSRRPLSFSRGHSSAVEFRFAIPKTRVRLPVTAPFVRGHISKVEWLVPIQQIRVRASVAALDRACDPVVIICCKRMRHGATPCGLSRGVGFSA